MPYFYYDWTMILVIPGLLLGLYAQFKVKSTFAATAGSARKAA